MTQKEYWLEALNAALEDVNHFHTISEDDKILMASSLLGSAECQGMAFPTPSVRDFENSEIKQLKKRIAELENKLSDADMDFRKNVAMRRNCDVNDVTLLGNGKAEFHY